MRASPYSFDGLCGDPNCECADLPVDPAPHAQVPAARILFLQSPEWDRRRSAIGQGALSLDPYAKDRCCWCYRPVKPGAPQLRLTRDDSGEWFVVAPPARAELPDEKTFGHFTLPIGPDCLRRHPEFRPGLVEDDPSGYLRLAAREGFNVQERTP